MRFATCGLPGLGLCALLVPPCFGNPQSVETYSGTQQFSIQLPGTINGSNIDFNGALQFTSLTFTPGCVDYGDSCIEFSGNEDIFLRAVYLVTLSVPNTPGSSVTARGTWTATCEGGAFLGDLTWDSLDLGTGFSENSFDIAPGSTFFSNIENVVWDPICAIPELAGNIVTIDGNYEVLSVGPPPVAAGFLQVSGTIYAQIHPSDTHDLPEPSIVHLSQNRPNPFNPSTLISFTLAEPAHVKLEIFGVQGRRVATLLDRELRRSVYNVPWDGRDLMGNPAPSGVYHYRLQAGDTLLGKKMVLVR